MKGGKIREEPIDISKVSDMSEMTQVDMKIYRPGEADLG